MLNARLCLVECRLCVERRQSDQRAWTASVGEHELRARKEVSSDIFRVQHSLVSWPHSMFVAGPVGQATLSVHVYIQWQKNCFSHHSRIAGLRTVNPSPLCQIQRANRCSPFTAWRRSEHSHAYCVTARNVFLSEFLPPVPLFFKSLCLPFMCVSFDWWSFQCRPAVESRSLCWETQAIKAGSRGECLLRNIGTKYVLLCIITVI